MRRNLLVVAMMLVAVGAFAQVKATPTAITKTLRSSTAEATVTVTAIDLTTREVTVKLPSGKEVILVVGEEAKNLDQIKVGDLVKIRYEEAVSLRLDKRSGGTASLSAEKSVMTGAPGSKPGGVAAHEVTLAVVIDAIDALNSFVTLKGPRGNEMDVFVKDRAMLGKINVGDVVEITYREALAISIEKVAAK
jgi:hypothetical protein